MEELNKEDIIKLKKALKFIRQGNTMVEKVNIKLKNDTLTNLTLQVKKDIIDINAYIKKEENNINEDELSKLIKALKNAVEKLEKLTDKQVDRQLSMSFE